MKLVVFTFYLLALPLIGFSQVRMDRLIIQKNEKFVLKGSDIIVVDTLIMYDSSKLFLNTAKEDNFIHAKLIQVGKGVSIIGKGKDGIDGKPGVNGYTAVGPCKNGTPGRMGTRGTSASNGVNLFLYFDKLIIAGSLLFELSGGDGGDGGDGGNGGGGSPGTRLCQGGTGGIGANGAIGGNGGNGGNLTLTCNNCQDLRTWLGSKILVRTYGGNAGLGGNGGRGGLAGLVSAGNNSKDGDQGANGNPGESGESGKTGAINFEQN